jgi:hypothetical protein
MVVMEARVKMKRVADISKRNTTKVIVRAIAHTTRAKVNTVRGRVNTVRAKVNTARVKANIARAKANTAREMARARANMVATALVAAMVSIRITHQIRR